MKLEGQRLLQENDSRVGQTTLYAGDLNSWEEFLRLLALELNNHIICLVLSPYSSSNCLTITWQIGRAHV